MAITGNFITILKLNAYINTIDLHGQIFEVQKEYARRNEVVTAEQARAAILHTNDYDHKTLFRQSIDYFR